MAETPWTSRCCESNCIQTRPVGDQVEIRDTERPEATLLVPAKAWEEFLASVRAEAEPRGEVREEWAVWIGPDEHGHAQIVGKADSPKDAEAEIARRPAWGRTYPGHVRVRTVHTGPWRAEVRNNEGESR